MDRAEFLKALDEILELEPGTLQGPEQLDDYPLWDSTAMISFVALAHRSTGTKLSAKDLDECVQVNDLISIARVV